MSAEPDLRRQPGPHVFVDDLATVVLADEDRSHLVKSLRLRDGDPLTVSDGAGRWRSAVFGPAVMPQGPIVVVAPVPYDLTLAIALTKSAKPELVVQKATEIGVDVVIVFAADRSVARWDDAKQGKALIRLGRVAREAAMQSRQVRIPSVAFAYGGLSSVASMVGPVRADFGGVAIDSTHRTIAIGPEGGWSENETDAIPAKVDLGRSVLRAETAALTAAMQMVLARSAVARRA